MTPTIAENEASTPRTSKSSVEGEMALGSCLRRGRLPHLPAACRRRPLLGYSLQALMQVLHFVVLTSFLCSIPPGAGD